MCGIAGIWKYNRSDIDLEILNQMSQKIYRRGSDDFGFAGWGGDRDICTSHEANSLANSWIALAHRRLSILDLSTAGWQPMISPDLHHAIAFNGEIYNYKELRQQLETKGIKFHSNSDTEVLLQAYLYWGKDNLKNFLNRLVGMFAFAILDTHKQTLTLARDFFGIKPLYYNRNSTQFSFASEIKALLPAIPKPLKANLQRVYDYLNSGVTDHGAATMFAGIEQLPAAHYLELSLENPKIAEPICYWDIDLNKRSQLSYKEAITQLRDLFLENVQLHLRSDVPVGAALSGGIDSSAIVSAMRYLEPNLEIHTFSYIADDPVFCEEKWVDIIQNACATTAHKVHATSTELVADLEELILAQDEPFGSTSIYAQYRVFKLAQQHGIKVMLDGQGADELLAGYRSCLPMRFASLIKQRKYLESLQFIRHTSKIPDVNILQGLAGSLLPSKIKRAIKRLLPNQATAIATTNYKWFADQGVTPSIFAQGSNNDLLREFLYQTLTTTSVPMLLRYEDRNSMNFSIESRVPFLTPVLAEFMLTLPEEYIIAPDGTSKSIFRAAMRGIVPDQILDRKDKIGFATPEQKWLKLLRPWVEKNLSSDIAKQMPMLNLVGIEQDWQNMLIGKSVFNFRIWRWVNLIKWAEQFDIDFN
ncbi:asparagine synthase (glutamine-hydrolyzing) [Pseudanabaena minima]|uniref:asparagine synthase (glutamine-hydrolyzing) n=1 Tax=Pseudanabaena minima TaxID=890415 RepID=UPI003DA8C7CB